MSSAWGARREGTGEGLRPTQEEEKGEGRPLSPSLPLKNLPLQPPCLCSSQQEEGGKKGDWHPSLLKDPSWKLPDSFMNTSVARN